MHQNATTPSATTINIFLTNVLFLVTLAKRGEKIDKNSGPLFSHCLERLFQY